MNNNFYRCPYFNDCHADSSHFYFDNKLDQSVSTIECKAPFIVKKNNSPVCALTIVEDEFKDFEGLSSMVKIYKKPLLKRIKDYFKR